ncbi:MAG TPA: S16 family serine protease [Candidatus Saccharimonadia bacterium]|nr:S16 family serine protease [Candidatus Saccharimonadia bacterium]
MTRCLRPHLGELGLEGDVRPIRGIVGKILVGKRDGIERFIIPEGNLAQAVLVPSIELVPVATLLQLYAYLNDPVTTSLIDTSDTPLRPEQNSIPSQQIQQRIAAARTKQAQRFSNPSKLNSRMSNRDIQVHAQLESDAKEVLDQAASSFGMSARSYLRTVKVARTIADLDVSTTIQSKHIAEALQYRPHSYHADN